MVTLKTKKNVFYDVKITQNDILSGRRRRKRRYICRVDGIRDAWLVVETGQSAREYFSDAIADRLQRDLKAKQAAELASKRELASRTPAQKAADIAAKKQNIEERRLQRIEKKERDAAIEAEKNAIKAAYTLRRNAHLSTEEILASGNGWTRHYVKKLLRPDWVEEVTYGHDSYRKDVIRHLYTKTQVEEMLPTLAKILSKRAMCRMNVETN